MQHIARKSTHNIDGLVVDKKTGEVLGAYTIHALTQTPYDHTSALPAKAPRIHPLYELDPAPRPDAAEVEVDGLPDGVIDLDAARSKRGPKPKVKPNQISSLLKVAHTEHRGWIDDYVFGACATVAGVSKGKLNVSPSHVLRACLLDEVSVEVVKRVIRLDGLRTMDDRTAQRICQCARFAIEGMEIYLERNLTVRQQLQYEVDFANSYYEDQPAALMASATASCQ
jgi:hypothetical protein